MPVSSHFFLPLGGLLSVLDDLKNAESLSDLAKVLGYRASALAFIVHQIPPSSKYTVFAVPKKAGGVRTISAPIDRLKTLQRHLSTILYECRAEIDSAHKLKPLSHGFRKSQSIITNAHQHIKSRYVLNADLEDFFPTINFGRVRGYLIKNNDFKLHADVATVIAQIACHNNELPQGAPNLSARVESEVASNASRPDEMADDMPF
ncbi:reverse transcriptase domain-containing protein [Bradyrhizobium ottawaense]|uniref:Reverse transcriptase domain-containing protein n=1 Tax=Bradyrhizobium ottawaense TaxID=931866 RepID=A0A2U8P5Z5_9BRAD|nr:hypothetical protein CIT37_13810 [Bradyrhizobium ottawaense]